MMRLVLLRGLILVALLAASSLHGVASASAPAAPDASTASAHADGHDTTAPAASSVTTAAAPLAPLPRHVPRALDASPPPPEAIDAPAFDPRPRPAWQRVARSRSDRTSDP